MKKITTLSWISNSDKTTQTLGQKIAAHLTAGDVVTLKGNLGAGKTTLVKGMARGLGMKSQQTVSSPTFVVIHQYEGKMPIYHLDWYRLKRVIGVDAAMAEECFGNGGVTLVEWPERGGEILPKNRLEIEIEHVNPKTRRLKLEFKGAKYAALRKKLEKSGL